MSTGNAGLRAYLNDLASAIAQWLSILLPAPALRRSWAAYARSPPAAILLPGRHVLGSVQLSGLLQQTTEFHYLRL